MIEVRGNLWEYDADVYVITTNGTVKKDGSCVMGRGCAREAKEMFPGIDKDLGKLISKGGNYPWNVRSPKKDGKRKHIWSFPVKNHWNEQASLELIEYSAMSLDLSLSVMSYPIETIVVPRPGCGNGGLDWKDVKPILEARWDDRYHVITW